MVKGRRRQTSAVEALIEQRRAQARADWARRHPAQAAAERQLRLERRTIEDLRCASKRKGAAIVEATAETLIKVRRMRQGALSRLHQSGAISIEQLGAALEIAEVYERVSGDVRVRSISLETRVDQSPMHDVAFFEALTRVRREMAYSAWRAALPGPAAPILAMIVHDVGVTAVARIHCMHVRRARRLLTESLDLWPDMLAAACAEVDETRLVAVQSQLA